MNYQDKALPIRTHAEYVAAKTAGAYTQYTGCRGDTYDMPRYGASSGGWTELGDWPSISGQWPLLPSEKIRAFYPELPEVEESEDTRFGIGLSVALLLGLVAFAGIVALGVWAVSEVLA